MVPVVIIENLPLEAIAKIRALWPEASVVVMPEGQVLSFGSTALSIVERVLSCGERATKLTPLEAELLAVLMRARGAPVERAALAASVHQSPGRPCSPRTIDSHVSHLRTKLRKAQLGLTVYSVYGAGYRVAEVG